MAKKIIKINPCPYCGGQAKVYAEAVRSFIFIHKYYVACMECGAATSQHDTEFLTRINDYSTSRDPDLIVDRLHQFS